MSFRAHSIIAIKTIAQPMLYHMHAALIILALAFWLLASAAYANEPSMAQFDALYAQLMQNPSDVDKTLEYSNMAVELGDYEAAIPPLERLLITNPDTPKLKLELGILYFLLGSHDVAKTYLQDAKSPRADGSMPKPAIVAGAKEYLKRM